MPEMTSYKHGQFSWVDLNAHDMAAAAKFYCDFFGWTAASQDTQGGPPYTQFELNGKSVGGLGQMSDEMKAAGVPPLWNSYVNVSDIDATVAKAQELGAELVVPVMKVLDAGSLAFLKDPTGGMLAVWQADKHAGAQLCNDNNTFCWNELVTRDLDKACDFFGKLFGWEFEEFKDSPAKYFVAKVDGNFNGGLMQMTEEWGDVPPHWMVYFAVDDTDGAVKKLTDLGGKCCVPPFDTAVGKIAVVSDPQGGTFSLIARKGHEG